MSDTAQDQRFQAFWDDLSQWSQGTFGSDAERGPVGPLKHLKKEADEALAAPQDLTEYADCLFLIFDATRRAGFSLPALLRRAEEKMLINKARSYAKPQGDEISEHNRDLDPA